MVKTREENRLDDIIETVVSMINYINTRPVKLRVYEKLCKEMGTDHKISLFHSTIHWLFKRKILTRDLELKDILLAFFLTIDNIKFDYCECLKNSVWCTKLSYLPNICNKHNALKSRMQGGHEIIK